MVHYGPFQHINVGRMDMSWIKGLENAYDNNFHLLNKDLMAVSCDHLLLHLILNIFFTLGESGA